MIESAGRKFLELLEAHRNALYTVACRSGTPNVAETALQRGIRSAFREYVRNQAPRSDQMPWLVQHINAELGENLASAAEPPAELPMPADVWARLAAAIQIEAATLGGADEQSMLAYDPLLAPRKKSGVDDPIEGLNLSPWTRFVIATAIVLFIGIVATIILTTHHAGPSTMSAATSTSPATAPVTPVSGTHP